ncbi:MAG TPA: hypothetical protein VL500_07855 [Candidatus Eisenbacteria bacterium]|nr:hypothetical protein [Candidatus Eisenbacteria bacterium]
MRRTIALASAASLLLGLAMPALANDDELKPHAVTVKLEAVGTSGESGTATLTREDGDVRVIISLTGEPVDASQPTHFHMGSCANLGAVKYPLNDIVNGTSSTKLDLSLDELLANLPLALNTHKSASEMAVNMACGDVKKPEERPAKPTFDGACMAAATDKREPALIAAYAAKNTAIAAALNARKTALHDAWLKPTFKERHDALRQAWKEWRAAAKKARQDFRKARHEAWKQFYADRKACAQKDRGTEHGTEDDDQD